MSDGLPVQGAPTNTVYVFRQLQAGEQRIQGAFERIDCPRTGPALFVRADGRLWRFTASALDAVAFIVYVPGARGAIGCGPRPAQERVYLTYRPARAPSEVTASPSLSSSSRRTSDDH